MHRLEHDENGDFSNDGLDVDKGNLIGGLDIDNVEVQYWSYIEVDMVKGSRNDREKRMIYLQHFLVLYNLCPLLVWIGIQAKPVVM